jgi:membrane-associated phospholipid phosphatase
VWLGAFTITTGFIFVFDQEILDAVQRNREGLILSPLIKTGEFFEPVGHMGIMNKYYFAALGIGYIFKINPLTTVAAQIIESHLMAGAFKNVSKYLVGRKRPFEDTGPYDFSFNGGTSFPSGHAINIFQLATILSHHIKFLPFQIFTYFVATGMAFQRIDSGNHWSSDVFFSALFGTVVSKAVLSLHHKRSLEIKPTVSKDLEMVGLRLEISW